MARKPSKPKVRPDAIAPLPVPLPLPHERDESVEVPGARRAAMKQAKRDLDAGLVDTDNYTRATAVSRNRKLPNRGTT